MYRSVRFTMTRSLPRTMECLALLTLLGMALPTAGEVFESSLDNLKSQFPFQCSKVTSTGCRKTNPERHVVLERIVVSFGSSSASCTLNRSLSTSYQDLTYFFNDNCLTKPIKNTVVWLNISQLISETIKSGCLGNSQKPSKLTVHYGCASLSTVSITSAQTTVVSSEAATSSRAQYTTAISTLPPIAITKSSGQAMTSSLPSTIIVSSSLSVVEATLATTSEKSSSTTSTSAQLSTLWSTLKEKSESQPVTSSGAASTTAGITATRWLENSESSGRAVTQSLALTSVISSSLSTVEATLATTGEKSALPTSTSVRSSTEWSKIEENSQSQPATSSGAASTTAGITATRRLENSAVNTPPPLTITESLGQAVTQSLPLTSIMSSSLSTVKATFATTGEKSALPTSTSVRSSTVWSKIEEKSQSQPATSSGAASTTAGITATRRIENSAINTLPPLAITVSSGKAVAQSLPPTTVMPMSLSTVQATFATTNEKGVLPTQTSVRPSTAWSTIEEKSESQRVTSSGAAPTSAGTTVTWKLENSERTIINVADGTLNQRLSTQPTNKTGFPSKAVANSEEWWQFFKTNEGIAVAVASLLVICLAICGLALLFNSRSRKGTESPGSIQPSRAFVETAPHNGHARGVPNGKEHSAEPGKNAPANLHEDALGDRMPSTGPTSTSGVLEHEEAFSVPFSSSFDEPSRRQSQATGRNLDNGPVAQSSPGSFQQDYYYAAIVDATEMLRPVEERRATLTSVGKPSAVEMTTYATAERGFEGMFATEDDGEDRESRAPPTMQLQHFGADVAQQFTANPQADQSSWSTSAGPQNGTPGYSFPVSLKRRASEMSVNTSM